MHGSGISIWFFIGISLLVNGVLITGAGAWDWVHPPQNPVVLFELHANFWWGLVLTLVGAFYCYHFAPGREPGGTRF
jgi:hypothetical protein